MVAIARERVKHLVFSLLELNSEGRDLMTNYEAVMLLLAVAAIYISAFRK